MNTTYTISFVAGARPNFMKIAPILKRFNYIIDNSLYEDVTINIELVHTGQHYDRNMSKIFFEELEIQKPNYNLAVGSCSHAEQTGKIMIEYERLLMAHPANMVVVVGDVNSTVACSLAAKKLHIPVAHVEAGLRSFDMTMPEEINRRLTDTISDLLFVTEQSGINNLINEGVSPERIKFTGNVMIDNLNHNLNKIKSGRSKPHENIFNFVKKSDKYAVLTLHRPSNVDNSDNLVKIWSALTSISEELPILFPVHPRTRKKFDALGLINDNIFFIEPIGFMDMLYAVNGSTLVLTDSGGLQEETTAQHIPCITIRENTERPCTVEIGTNYLAGTEPQIIIDTARTILSGKGKKGSIPPLWDGQASYRIADDMINFLLST